MLLFSQEKSITANIIDFGLVKPNNYKKYYNDLSAIGSGSLLKSMEFIEQTDQIPMQIGNGFGISFKIDFDDPKNKEIIIIHISPEPIKYRNQKGTIYSIVKRPYNYDIIDFTGYMIEKPEELIPGEWTILIIYKDKILLEKKYYLQK
jgi:hypothetical protein